jgi:hypothetical protein
MNARADSAEEPGTGDPVAPPAQEDPSLPLPPAAAAPRTTRQSMYTWEEELVRKMEAQYGLKMGHQEASQNLGDVDAQLMDVGTHLGARIVHSFSWRFICWH